MIALENVSKNYGKQAVLSPTSLAFARRQTTVLIGPSGCGKSTLLRIIMGLIQPDEGRVFLGGDDPAPGDVGATRLKPPGAGRVELTPGNAEELRHGIGYVIQDGGLFPHLTVEQNITLLARFLKRPPAEMQNRVADLADLARLPREMLSRYPAQLSGGQRQRVGLMRALMLDPELLLLDEPLGALDPITRFELQTQLKEIFGRLEKTVVMVTHDMGEAAYFGDTIVLMREGRIVQRGSLDDLLHRPAESYVSDFIRAQRSPLPPLPEEKTA